MLKNNHLQTPIIDQIKSKIAKLNHQKDWQIVLLPWLRTQLTYTSNSLEGNTLSLIETSIIINENQGVAGKSLREIYEAENHAKAWDYIQKNLVGKKTNNLNEDDLLKIHSLILGRIDDLNAGKYRNVTVRISGSNTIFPNPLKVSNLMEQIFIWLKTAESAQLEEILNLAILCHLKIVKIHPFSDGKGRTARLFAGAVLMQNNLPPIDILPENRKEYLEALENSDSENPAKFIDFILQTYNQNLETYLATFAD